jgi:PAS domain S-box-containing protein
MALPDLSGAAVGRYQVSERLAGDSVVYRAIEEPTARQVALKLLDPELTGRAGFLPRLVEQTATIGGLGDGRIVPVYEVATHEGLGYLTMRLVRGGTLKNLLSGRALDVHAATRIARDVGGALERANEAGVVHQNLKPSNVLIETDGSIMVSDFGLAPVRYGRAIGTPGYMSPEQALGGRVDRRSDVHALGLLLFEMVTGTMAYRGDTPPSVILATVAEPVPSARARNPDVPAALEEVLSWALAKDPDDRPGSVADLLGLLDRARLGAPAPGWADDQFATLIEASMDPVVAMDAEGRITHWNSRAESAFGWSRPEVVGRPVLPLLIAPRHRELFERVLAGLTAGGAPPPEGRPIEVMAIHREGRQITMEVSVSRLSLPAATSAVAFCRDVSERRESERLGAMRRAVSAATSEPESATRLMRDVLEAVGSALGWPAGAVWLHDEAGSKLRCRGFWCAPSLAGSELEALSESVDYPPGVGLPGRAWSMGQPLWQSDLGPMAESARERAALRAGLRAAGAFPIAGRGSGPIGVLEFFSVAAEAPGPARLAEVEAVGRRVGDALDRPPAAHPGRVRYRLDTRNTHLAFSCAFMKLMTVHGIFRDFSGWLELDDNDPRTARAECTIRPDSVDTGSLDRDYHLRSDEFFGVRRFPHMVFRSTGVHLLGDERFRLFGDLTIRDITRPMRLEVRLEDREVDRRGGERMTLTAGTVINRLDWFLDWEKALEAGRWIVGNEVRLDLVIALVRRPELREQVL